MLLVSRVEALRVCECFIVSLCFLALVAEVSKKVIFFFSLGFESEAKELVFDDLRMWVFMVLSSGLPLQVCKVSGFWFFYLFPLFKAVAKLKFLAFVFVLYGVCICSIKFLMDIYFAFSSEVNKSSCF